MEMDLMKKKKKKGFTLIELIVVIAILGILAAIAIPKLSGFQNTAKLKADIADAKTLATATATLIAGGTITVPASSGSDLVLTIGNTSTPPTEQTAIEGYLQTIPKPKASGAGANFIVTVTKVTGVVTVTAGSGNPCFPVPATGGTGIYAGQ